VRGRGRRPEARHTARGDRGWPRPRPGHRVTRSRLGWDSRAGRSSRAVNRAVTCDRADSAGRGPSQGTRARAGPLGRRFCSGPTRLGRERPPCPPCWGTSGPAGGHTRIATPDPRLKSTEVDTLYACSCMRCTLAVASRKRSRVWAGHPTRAAPPHAAAPPRTTRRVTAAVRDRHRHRRAVTGQGPAARSRSPQAGLQVRVRAMGLYYY
jgi:hypothetical protein